ncbi:MAG: AAA family ATPase [Pseudomonadota bacterium]|nr:AAA family ATPase [Pseudomonadota bacterium]
MHLKNVILRNFRCFKELSLDLHPRLTVLVAENGGGKTSVLDGIAIGLAPVRRYLSSADQRLSAKPGISDNDFHLETFKPDQLPKKCAFTQIEVETTNEIKWDKWRAASKGKKPNNKIGQTKLAAYGSNILESLKSNKPELLPVFAYYGAKRGWVTIPTAQYSTKIDFNQPASALAGALESLSDFKNMLKWFDLEEIAELRTNKGCKPEDYQESDSLTSVRAAVALVLGDIYKNPHFDSQHKFVVESKTGPNLLQVSQLSQGYQSMLALAMDFARRLALANKHLDFNNIFDFPEINEYIGKSKTDKESNWNTNETDIGSLTALAPAIMLVDEIDLHLHPSWQQRVLDDLMRAFPGTQFIVTTHSPQVLTTVPSESIRVLEDGKVYAAPPGSEGAESSRVLKRILGVNSRPLENEATRELNEYLKLVDNDQWNSDQALELRKKLDERYQNEEPALLEADLHIENRKWEMEE